MILSLSTLYISDQFSIHLAKAINTTQHSARCDVISHNNFELNLEKNNNQKIPTIDYYWLETNAHVIIFHINQVFEENKIEKTVDFFELKKIINEKDIK